MTYPMPDPERQTVLLNGAALRAARLKAKKSQAALADLLGVTQPVISNYEMKRQTRVDRATVRTLAAELKVTQVSLILQDAPTAA